MTLIMRVYSYLYHGGLALFLLAVSGLALLGGSHNLQLKVLPWSGATLTYVLLLSALFGLASVLLALKGIARPLFLVWSVVVALMLIKGFFLSSYHFGAGDLSTAMYLTLGALLAVTGAWSQVRRQAAKRQSRFTATVSR
ncbi:MAG: hypothetical protein M1541_08715 [Acidobacteria bacterium]|nr:hypothetical protein [Acidobacteriota bacterium]